MTFTRNYLHTPVIKDGKPLFLIEAKHWAQKLDNHDSQLVRYFNISRVRFAILTNGLVFRFFTDLAELNRMDEKPFLEFEFGKMTDAQIEELKKFHKSVFDVAGILSSASELKYMGELKTLIGAELKTPSEAFVKYFAAKVFEGRMTDKVVFQFSDYVRRATHQVVSEIVTDRFKSAIEQEKQVAQQNEQAATAEPEPTVKQIETTATEMEGFYIIKSILRQKVDAIVKPEWI